MRDALAAYTCLPHVNSSLCSSVTQGLNHPGVLVVGSGGLYSGSKDVMGNPPANSSDDDAAEDIPTDSPDA